MDLTVKFRCDTCNYINNQAWGEFGFKWLNCDYPFLNDVIEHIKQHPDHVMSAVADDGQLE